MSFMQDYEPQPLTRLAIGGGAGLAPPQRHQQRIQNQAGVDAAVYRIRGDSNGMGSSTLGLRHSP